jgi:sn-glycerol 3-phosphate transport system permease protein
MELVRRSRNDRLAGPPRPRHRALAYLLVLPSLAIFTVFVFYPLVRNVVLGLYRTPPFPGLPRRYAGLGQYRQVLTSADFRNSITVTVFFALLTVPAGITLGLALAVLAHQRLRGITVFRTIFSSTLGTSVAVASVIFFTLLNPQVGLFTYYLGREGSPSLLADPKWALVAVSATTVWQNLGLTFILMSAALSAIPDELLEAACIDGAGAWSRFRHVTLPLLSPTVFFAVVVGSIVAFQAFGQVDIMTQGGPFHHTDVLVYFIYREVLISNNDGVAAVLAMALFAITLLLTLAQLRLLERRVFYARS